MSDLRCYGITTTQITVGLSACSSVLPGSALIDNVIVGMTGAGLLFAAGFSSANNGSLVAAGALISSGSVPLSLGVAPVYFTATGAAVVVSVLRKLSSGYSGQQTGTP
jgi:hypothetical protein